MTTKPVMLKLAPGDEEVEDAVANALEGLKVEEVGQPMVYTEPEDVSHGTLIEKSKASFQNHLDQLQTRIEAVNREIALAVKARDEMMAKAEARHMEIMREFERDLYQIKTLRGAVELAIVALGYDD